MYYSINLSGADDLYAQIDCSNLPASLYAAWCLPSYETLSTNPHYYRWGSWREPMPRFLKIARGKDIRSRWNVL